MTQSLQTRLLAGIAIGMSIVLIVAGVVLYALIRGVLTTEFDASLASEARLLATLVEEKNGHLQTEMTEHGDPTFQPNNRRIYYQLWNHEGDLVEGSKDLSGSELTRFGGTPENPEFLSAVLPGNHPGRMVGLQFVPYRELERKGPGDADGSIPEHKEAVTLVVARDTLELNHTLNQIGLLLLGVFGVAVVISIFVAALIVQIGLRPLEMVSSQIKTLDTYALDDRLDSTHVPVEIQTVIECLNALLNRLQDAFQRERAFSANVAHELRTPLAGLRSTIDVALAKPVESADYRRSLERCLTISKQAESLTESLLVLARLDAGQCQLQSEVVELTELLRTQWFALEAQSEKRSLRVAWHCNDEIRVISDRSLLSLILRNLLDNAVSYATRDGEIEIGAYLTEAKAVITVQNPTLGLPKDSLDRIFDRFWRADASRTATGLHAGLGLSLCKEASRALNGDLTVSIEKGIFKVELILCSLDRTSEKKFNSEHSDVGA